jgi:L-ascorbate oxidase
VRQSDQNALSTAYDVDSSEHVMIVHDWLNQIVVSKYTKFLIDDGDEFIDAILINGRGVDVNDKKIKKKSDPTVPMPRAVFEVEKGNRYRFRVINSGVQFCPLQLSIDSHNLTVISTDGNDIEPLQVVSIIILAGKLS